MVNPARDHVIIGRERNDVGRPHDEGYPVRGIIKGDFVYLQNFEPSRWPAGNPETGYLDCDGSPTKTFILEAHRKNPQDIYWARCFGMRPSEEFYDLKHDRDCLNNLAQTAQKHFDAIGDAGEQRCCRSCARRRIRVDQWTGGDV